jgi:hypothetical protein
MGTETAATPSRTKPQTSSPQAFPRISTLIFLKTFKGKVLKTRRAAVPHIGDVLERGVFFAIAFRAAAFRAVRVIVRRILGDERVNRFCGRSLVRFARARRAFLVAGGACAVPALPGKRFPVQAARGHLRPRKAASAVPDQPFRDPLSAELARVCLPAPENEILAVQLGKRTVVVAPVVLRPRKAAYIAV